MSFNRPECEWEDPLLEQIDIESQSAVSDNHLIISQQESRSFNVRIHDGKHSSRSLTTEQIEGIGQSILISISVSRPRCRSPSMHGDPFLRVTSAIFINSLESSRRRSRSEMSSVSLLEPSSTRHRHVVHFLPQLFSLDILR